MHPQNRQNKSRDDPPNSLLKIVQSSFEIFGCAAVTPAETWAGEQDRYSGSDMLKHRLGRSSCSIGAWTVEIMPCNDSFATNVGQE